MTAVAVRAPQPPADRSAPTRAAKIGAALANSRDVLEAPFRLIDAAYEVTGAQPRDALYETGNPSVLARAKEWLADQSPRAEVQALHDKLAGALNAPVDQASARMTLGLLLEGYPNTGKEVREGYFATLLHDVLDESVGPYLLAEACKVTRRRLKFLPTVSELLSSVGEVTCRLSPAVDHLARVLECFDRCEAVIAAHDVPPAEWSDDMWLDALNAWGRNHDGVWSEHLGPMPGEPGCLASSAAVASYRSQRSYGLRRVV